MKDVPGFEGRYAVTKDGCVWSHHAGRFLKPEISAKGYCRIRLGKNGPKFHVAALVLAAFVGPRPSPEHEAAHNDGNKNRNVLGNLRWDTAKGNRADMRLHGTLPQGERQWCSKLTEDQVREMRASTESHVHFARKFGVSASLVGQIRRGNWWKHVEG